MADINLSIGGEQLEELKKQIQELNKEIQKLKKLEVVGDDDVTRAKKQNAELLKAANALKRQEQAAKTIEDRQEKINQKQKESVGIIGRMEAEQRKLRSAVKSAQTEMEKKGAQKQLEKVNRELVKARGSTAGWGKALGSFQFKFNALGNIAANVVQQMTTGIKRFMSDTLTAYNEQIRAQTKVITAIRSTGSAAKFTASELFEVARSLQRITTFGDEDILNNVTAQLLTFTNIAGDNFIRTQQVALDLATVLDGDLKAASIQLGKALNDPVKNLSALSRSGIQFSKEQTATIKTLAETNRLAEAQSVILDELERQYGGQAEAAAAADVSFRQLGNALGDLQEAIGALVAPNSTQELIGIVERLTESVTALGNQSLTAGDKLRLLFGSTGTKAAIRATAAALDEVAMEFDEVNIQQAKLTELKNEAIAAAEIQEKRELALVEAEKQRIEGIKEKFRLRKDDKQLQDAVAKANQQEMEQFQVNIDAEIEGILESQDAFISAEEAKTAAMQTEAEKRKQAAIEEEQLKQKIIAATFQVITNFTTSLSNLYQQQKENELSAAGDNAEKRLEIEKDYAKKQQTIAIAQAVINGAVAVTKSFRDLGPILGSIFAVLTAASVGIQIATIKKQKFAKGGLIGGRPHSQGGTEIEAERGEYVINKRSTSKYRDLIEGINENDQLKILSALDKDRGRGTIKADPYTKKMYELLRDKEDGYETPHFYVVRKGTTKTMLRK